MYKIISIKFNENQNILLYLQNYMYKIREN